MNGKNGGYCSQSCPAHCRLSDGVTWGCYQFGGDCSTCKPGYYDKGCIERCSSNCAEQTCIKSNGNCQCKPGFKIGKCTEGLEV